MSQGWAEMDGNGHYWPAQPPSLPPSFYATPADPLVSPNFEGWWRRGFALARQVWKPAAIVYGAVAVPAFALLLPANLLISGEQERYEKVLLSDSSDALQTFDWASFLTAYAALLGALLITALFTMFAMATTVSLVVSAATAQPVDLGTAMKAALRRYPAILGWSILGGLLTSVAFLFCILPSIYVAAVLMVLTVVVMLERGNAVSRCFRLFHSSLETSLSRIATVVAGQAVIGGAVGMVGAAFDLGIGGTVGTTVSTALTAVYSAAAGIFVTPLLVTAYADMRSRHEPFSTAYLAPTNPTPDVPPIAPENP